MSEYLDKQLMAEKERAIKHREIANEAPFPLYWSKELAEQWAITIPGYLELNRLETPVLEFDLSKEGLGTCFIKDESRREINPTGTMKDSMARSIAAIYQYEARCHLSLLANLKGYEKRLEQSHLTRYSLITSGNAGGALANAFRQYNLPPPKLLLDKNAAPQTINFLKNTRADVYLTDLSTNPFTGKPSEQDPMQPWQIKFITNNEGGKDLTSAGAGNSEVEVHTIFYKKLIEKSFAQKPDETYKPYGSGVLHSEFLLVQYLASFPNDGKINEQGKNNLSNIKIFGAEPKDLNSVANKLTAPAKPFAKNFEESLTRYRREGTTPIESGVGKVSEAEILEAYNLMKKYGEPQGLRTEPSASAGFALYIKRKRAGLIPEGSKILIINTGCGIVSEAE